MTGKACQRAERILPQDLHVIPLKASRDVPAERVCMSCRQRFWSEGFSERICRRCKSRKGWTASTQTLDLRRG